MAFNPFEPTEKEKQFSPFEPEINDDDNIFEAAYHGLAGATGNVIKTAGHLLNYAGKPSYVSDEEWARRQGGGTVFGINKAIEDFGREMEEEHQRNYSEPLGANSIASGIGSVAPYAVALGLTARSGRAVDPAGLGEAAGIQLGQRVAPHLGQTAARVTEAVVPGLALGQRQALPEALLEMENAQEDYVENAKAQGQYKPGVTEAEAERVGRSVLSGNLGFITGTDAAQNALINSVTLGQGSRARRALQAIGIGGGINAAQEIGQQIIPKEAKGEDWSFTDPDIVLSGIVGGITGGLPSAVAAAIDSRSRTADNFGENAVNDALNAVIAGAANGKEAFINAIAGQESGGDYNAVNGRTGAAGKYQIMPENWPAWAEEAGLGRDAEMTPENQEIVARFKLGQYYDKYGARNAAIAWYGGEGAINYSEEAKNRKQGNGDEPSINEYADSVMRRMGAGVGRRDLRSMYADDTDQAIADMNNTPAIRLPEQRQDIDFSGRGEAEDNAALNSYNETDERRTMGRNEAADYAELTGEETDNAQQWNTPRQRTLRMPRRTSGVTYNPATAMETPYLDQLNRQTVNRRADELAAENQRVMQETAGRRERFTGQGTPAFRALMQRTQAARNQRQQSLNNALRSNNLANLTARAMNGDHGARQTFDKLRPEVRSVLLNRHIDRLNVQNMDEQADEARKALKLAQEQQEAKDRAQREADKRELLQGAEEYLRGSYDSPAEGARAELRDAKAGINSLLQPIIDQLRDGMGNGVTLAPAQGREDGRMVRLSNNAPWYQEWHKEHKRKPTQKELEDIARDVYTGRNSYGLPGWEVNQENEAEFAQNRATLQEMDDFVNAYEQLEKKFAAEPNGGRRSGTSEESNAGEVAARGPAETEQADNENAEAESEVSKKAAAELADGYKTESGRPLSEADADEFIVKPDGSIDFGEITQEIANATNGELEAAPVRLQVGTKDFGYKHLLKHLKQIESKGFDNPFDFISYVLNNFNQVYSQQTTKRPHRFVLYCKGDNSKGFMPMDLEFENNGNYYTIVSAMPHNEKIKGTLIYDGSTRPSTATTNGLLSTDTNNEGGDGAAIVLAKSNVPNIREGLTGRPRPSADQQASQSDAELRLSGTNIIPQNEAENKTAPNTADNAQGGAQQAESSRQEQTPARTRKSAKKPKAEARFIAKGEKLIPQTAELRGNEITVISKPAKNAANNERLIGVELPEGEYTVTVDEWKEAGKFGNPNYRWHNLVREKYMDAFPNTVTASDGFRFMENPIHDRIIDNQITAIKQAVKAYDEAHATPEQTETTQQQAEPASRFDGNRAASRLDELIGRRKPEQQQTGKKFMNVFDESELDAEIAKAKAEMSKLSANPFFNPALMKSLFKIGGIYMQRGVNNFADWSARMVDTLGSKVRPFLKSAWDALQAYPADVKFNDDIMTATLEFVGSRVDNGRSRDEIRSEFREMYGDEYVAYIDAAYEGVSSYPTEIAENADVVNETETQEEAGEQQTETAQEPAGSQQETAQQAESTERTETPAPEPAAQQSANVPQARFNLNEAQNGIEIKFLEEPSQEVLTGLKNAGFRWSRFKKHWYSKQNPRAMAFAESIGYVPQDVVQSNQEINEAPPAPATEPAVQQPAAREQEATANGNDNDADGYRAAPENVPAAEVQGTESERTAERVREPEVEGRSVQVAGDNGRAIGERTLSGERRPTGESTAQSGTGSDSKGTSERGSVRALRPAQKKKAKASEVPGHNFTITADENIGKGGAKTKYKDNVAAIKLLKQLEAEDRLATPEEQKVLARYVGWGGLAPVFSYGRDSAWESEKAEIRELLTDEEYNAARASTNNAHYTSPEVIKGVWDIIERLGFKGGKVLEPSMGIGNFFGMMPEKLRSKSSLNGVELDSLTGRIAKQLYQKASVEINGYEKTKYPDNYFDLAISNVPFGDYKLHDPKYDKYKFNIHNYFFAKAIDQVRPGGLVAFITSTGTMQSGSDAKRLREILKDKADFIGAVRLPDTAFKENAGTEVTTDLIILQKREPGAAPGKNNHAWLDTKDTEVRAKHGGYPLQINEYYSDNPEMLIGELKEDTLYYGGRLALDGTGLDVGKELESRVEKFPKNIYKQRTTNRNTNSLESAQRFLAPSGVREGQFVINENSVFANNKGEMTELPKAMQARAKDYVGLREVTKKILDGQINPQVTDETLDGWRKDLNKVYDKFVAKHGYLNSPKNKRDLAQDPDFGIVSAIEKYTLDKKSKKESAAKADIFRKRTVNPIIKIDKADNPSDALALSLSNTGAVDIDYMAELTGQKPADIVKALKGFIYKDPATNTYVTAEEYLSGNVRQKLELAEFWGRTDPEAAENVEALKKVQPVDLTPEEISVNLGTPWIPESDLRDFAQEMLGMPNWEQPLDIRFNKPAGTWLVAWNKGWRVDEAKRGTEANQKWGTSRRGFATLLDDALNQRTPTVYDTSSDGKRSVNQQETLAAQQKLREIQDEFKKWIWKDKDRADRLAAYYNRNFNNMRLREYNGSMLTLPGYSSVAPPLKQHQKDAVWRIIQDGTALLAHTVGAGKTWTMQTAAMELKRLGIVNKSMFVIPNHMLQQFENEFRIIYPNAKLLTISSENLPDVPAPAKKGDTAEAKKRRAAKIAERQKILSRIATEDWDGIIISHNMFKRIPMSPEAYSTFYQEQIDNMRTAIIELTGENDRNSNRLVKELEKKAKSLEERLKRDMNEENKDIVIPFEQLGIDEIFVDEADLFKNLFFVTKMNRIGGLSNTNSQRSLDMYMKTQYLAKHNNGRGIVFATGTPISNTMAEMFTMLRYLDGKGLKENDLDFFDNWAAQFAERETVIERSPDGQGWRQAEKFTKFKNMPELIKMFRKVADVKTQADLNLDIPKLKNGKPTVIEVEPNSALTDYIKNTAKERAQAIHDRKVDPSEDNMLKLTGDLRKASLDMRLIDPTVPESVAGGKLRAVADNVYKKYKESDSTKGAQLVFCDLSTPKGTSDKVVETDGAAVPEAAEDGENVTAYEEIKKNLVKKGIPSEEIAFIHDAKTKEQKEELFAKVRDGRVRVLIGSTEKMGAGTNVQKKLVALHHVDAPWRPRDIEQREGRILRQGNENAEVEIFNYVTKDSFDANMWEKLKNKATMIAQALSNNLSGRTLEDADANVLSFAEIESLASGNPLVAERVAVNAELNKYEALYASYRKNQAANERKANNLPATIEYNKNIADNARADIKNRSSIEGDKFSITLGKKVFNKRADAKAALEAYASNKSGTARTVGKIGGFELRLRPLTAGESYSQDGNIFAAQEGDVKAELVGKNTYTCEATLGSIEHAVMHAPEKTLDRAQRNVESSEKELKAVQAEIAEPFKYLEKYEELKKRSAEIDKELGIGEAEYSATTEPAAQRSSEEVLRELQDALPNGKFEDAGGGEYTVILPNDARIKVNIADRMVVNNHEAARARGAHGLMRGGELNIEGSWQSFKGSDVDGLLNLSRTGRAGTAYHEVMHAAMDLALTAKEQQAMVKHFNKEAQATGKTVSEAISDGYVEWKRARAQRRGTLFGKLFNKMQDMLNTLKSLFTGVENAHNVMRRVESGEVWQRSRSEGNAAGNYSVTNARITGRTEVPVVDVTGLPKVNVNSNTVKTKIAKGLIGKTLRIIGSDGIGRVASMKDGKHIVNSSNNPQRSDDTRRQALSVVDNILNSAVYVEKHPDARHGTNARYIELYAAVKNGNNLTRFRIVAKEGDNTAGEFEVKDAKFYDIIKDGTVSANMFKNILPASVPNGRQGRDTQNVPSISEGTPAIVIPQSGMQNGSVPSTISVAQLLTGVKDRSGKLYVKANGELNYEAEALKAASNVQYSAEELTPEQKAAQAFTNTERKTTWQSAKDWVKKQRTEFYRDWIDKNDSLHGLDEAIAMTTGIKTDGDQSVYNRVQTLPATTAGMANALIEGDGNSLKALNERLKYRKLPHNVTMQMVLDNINHEKMDKAHPNYLKRGGFKNWIDAFGAYLGSIRLNEMLLLHDEAYHQRVKEWEANGGKGKKPEYKPYLLPKGLTQDDLESVIRNAPPEFRKAAQMYWKFNDNILTVMEDAGLISGETHKLLNTKYKYYCPLMRDFSDTAAADNFINGLSNGGRGIGNVSSMLRRISIEGSERNVINPLESTIKAVAVMCNRAERNKVGQMAVELAQKGGLDAVIQEAEGTVADPKNCIFTVMFNGKKHAYKTTQELYGPIVGYNLPAAGFVLGVARNAARLLRTGATISPSFIIRNLIRDTVFAGVSSKNGFMPVVDTIRGAYALARDPRLRAEFKVAGVTQFNFYSSSEQIVKSLDEMAGGKAWKDYGAADILRPLMKYPAFASEFIESSSRMGEFMKARKKGASLEEAAQAARELTLDFSRSGVQGEKVNQIVPFFNAVLQGGDKMVRLIKQDPVGTGTKLAMYIVLPSLALWALNHDEDWYKEIDPEVKATCWLLPGGLRIPKPQEAGILFGSGIEAVLDHAFNKDPEAISNWAKVFGSNMAPSIMPTIFLPLIEWQANYSFFRGQSITPQRLQNLPDELQYTPNTSALARTVGGALKRSPVKIDNTIRGYTGTMGMILVQQFDWFADDKQNMPYKKVSEWPFLRDFTVNQNIQNRSVDDFYKMLHKANEQHAGYGKKGKPTPAVQGVRKAGQLISKAQKDIRELTVNPRLSPEVKRQRIDQRKAFIKNVAQKANMRFGRFFED
jgi:N12 class adenine-specific DNA methylase